MLLYKLSIIYLISEVMLQNLHHGEDTFYFMNLLNFGKAKPIGCMTG